MWNDKRGNMFKYLGKKGHCIVITTNQTLKKDGRLVMGKGAAYELVKRLKHRGDISKLAGKKVKGLRRNLGKRPYGFLFLVKGRVGMFQTKYNYFEDSDTYIIRFSATKLRTVCLKYPKTKFHLNYPGIGFGNLPIEHVKPVLDEVFKDVKNLYIWQLHEDVEEFDG